MVHRESPFAYTAYQAYIFTRLSEGIPTIITTGERDTALTLGAMVYNSMKSTHDGLNKYATRKRKRQKGESQEYVGYIRLLTTIPGIGEKTAISILKIWDTPWDFFDSELDDIADVVSPRVAELLRTGIGKDN